MDLGQLNFLGVSLMELAPQTLRLLAWLPDPLAQFFHDAYHFTCMYRPVHVSGINVCMHACVCACMRVYVCGCVRECMWVRECVCV